MDDNNSEDELLKKFQKYLREKAKLQGGERLDVLNARLRALEEENEAKIDRILKMIENGMSGIG
ncbi:MAG: hypothetical protein AAF934_11265 [Bacteroidota bacterium]